MLKKAKAKTPKLSETKYLDRENFFVFCRASEEEEKKLDRDRANRYGRFFGGDTQVLSFYLHILCFFEFKYSLRRDLEFC